jgi:hypothetical protein
LQWTRVVLTTTGRIFLDGSSPNDYLINAGNYDTDSGGQLGVNNNNNPVPVSGLLTRLSAQNATNLISTLNRLVYGVIDASASVSIQVFRNDTLVASGSGGVDLGGSVYFNGPTQGVSAGWTSAITVPINKT